MRPKVIIISFLFLMPIYAFAQKGYIDKINQYDNKGQKEGYWIEDRKFDTIELFYKRGQKTGVFKSYSKRGTLSAFGEYLDGEITGTWYYFGDKGHLMSIQKDFRKNNHEIPSEHDAQGKAPYQCYTITYYPNGTKESEGLLLWDVSPESDFTFEFGEWKYYDETGKLTKTKEFK